MIVGKRGHFNYSDVEVVGVIEEVIPSLRLHPVIVKQVIFKDNRKSPLGKALVSSLKRNKRVKIFMNESYLLHYLD